jgi:hypothetical protein
VEPAKRERARQAMLDNPAVLSFPELGARPMHRAKAGGDYNLVMQWKLSRGDTTGVKKDFEKLRELQRGLRPGDIAFDVTYQSCWLLLAIGDTAEAKHLLDLSLEALPTLGTGLIDQLPEVAALVRGMALRAELAKRAGDDATAKRWASDVTALWSGADPELQPTVIRMRDIASHP